MYHPQVTERAIDRLQQALDAECKRKKEKLWQLEYHSIRQVERTNKHFQDLLDDDGQLRRPLKPDEQRWIRNERMVCQADFRYWSSRYAKIRNWEEQLILFSPNIAQQITIDIWGEMEAAGRGIEEQDLKARQLGISTVTELGALHRTQFYPHVNAVVASSDPQKSLLMSQMMERALDNQPWFLVPKITGYNKGELIEFGDQDSGITVQHGTQVSGIARGSTPTVCHLSELIDFDNPEQLVDAALFRAMHPSPWLFLVLESTALGRHNWWHDTWIQSKEKYHLGLARLRPKFLPWFVGQDIYPTETWLRARPIRENWIPAGITQKHAERAEAYVRSNELLRKYLGENWTMPREQMWFWEVEREVYKDKGLLSQWHSEMPADDVEAFQSTSVSAIDAEVISIYRENCTKAPLGVFGFNGPGIPPRLQPDRRDIDTSRPPIKVDEDYTLIPLRFHGYASTDPLGKLFIWEWPKPGFEHGIGVDTSDGIGLDRSVIEGMRKGDFILNNDTQVCEFASPYVNSADLAPLVYPILKLYSVPIGGTVRQAKAVIECMGNGSNTQLELRKMGWANFHQWTRYDKKKLNLAVSQTIGWVTNSWSRPMMMDYLLKALRDGMCDINSPWFVDEMADLDRDISQQSIKATFGAHDDRIMAWGIVWFSLHIMELLGPVRSAMQRRSHGPDNTLVYPRYQAGWQARDTGSPRVSDLDEDALISSALEIPAEFPEW